MNKFIALISLSISLTVSLNLSQVSFVNLLNMHIHKYSDIAFLKFLIIFHLLQPNSIRELSYRLKKIDKEKN